jgi:putative transcriptional regulator
MEIGNRVKELRAKNSWTQEKLAQAVGVTRQTIAALEKGDYIPSLLLALKICEAFQLKMEEVFWLLKEEER